jgi:aldose 1-epimerase
MKILSFVVLVLVAMVLQSSANDHKHPQPEPKMKPVQKQLYGKLPDGTEIYEYTLSTGVSSVGIINYGGIVTHIDVPDKNGKIADVVLGCSSLEGYRKSSPYFGCVVGRYANRIARGTFTLNGHEYHLAANDHRNHLHGGIRGFDKVVWQAEPFEGKQIAGVRLTYTSADGEEGYPGTLMVTVTYSLDVGGKLQIEYDATCDSPTVINLSHHSYFNLAGEGNGDVLGHLMKINAGRYTVVDSELIPTGELRSVEGTPMDFRSPTAIGARIVDVPGGYDHNYVLDRKDNTLASVARVTDPVGGRVLVVSTTEPGLQFYSGNFLDGTITGRGGKKYPQHGGFCLEAQHFPDSPNHPEFPSTVLMPGSHYRQTTVYHFLCLTQHEFKK